MTSGGDGGRTYAIPFDTVWRAAVAIVDGGARGWRIVDSDDQAGVIHARRTGIFLRRVREVHVRIGLDENGQTRVHVDGDRRAGRLVMRRLDAQLAGAPVWSS